MSPASRARDPRGLGSSFATFAFVLGCLTVLGLAFALGVSAGRRWPNGFPLLGGAPATSVRDDGAGSRRADGRGLDRERSKSSTEGTGAATFYRELTAPLSSPPPQPVVAPRPAPPATAVPAGPPAPTSAPPPLAPSSPPTSERRFTVQVGAFTTWAQAEALRARLAEGGHDVSTAEVQAGGVMQYRVRVGSFATREAAREVAARLGSERRLATYVTTR